MAVHEGEVRKRRILHDRVGVLARDLERPVDDAREPGVALRLPTLGDARVVGLTERVVGLRDEERARLAKEPHTAQVVHVALGDDDVGGRPGADGVEEPLVRVGLEAQARVDDHAAGLGDHHGGVGGARGEEDAGCDFARFGGIGGAQHLAPGALHRELSDAVVRGHGVPRW